MLSSMFTPVDIPEVSPPSGPYDAGTTAPRICYVTSVLKLYGDIRARGINSNRTNSSCCAHEYMNIMTCHAICLVLKAIRAYFKKKYAKSHAVTNGDFRSS